MGNTESQLSDMANRLRHVETNDSTQVNNPQSKDIKAEQKDEMVNYSTCSFE